MRKDVIVDVREQRPLFCEGSSPYRGGNDDGLPGLGETVAETSIVGWRKLFALGNVIWLVIGLSALIVSAPAPAQQAHSTLARLELPTPLSDPRTIDFGTDPVLSFVTRTSPSDDFIAAVASAVTRHPVLAEATAAAGVARAQRRETRAGLFPTLSASVTGSQSLSRDFIDTSAAVERLLPRGRADASLNADQLLFDFGATSGRIAGASARLRAANAEADRAASATALAATQAWYQIIGFQALVELSDALIDRHRTILSSTRARTEAGVGTGGDVARAEAGLADAIGDGARNARSLASVRARYRELFGSEAPLHLPRPKIDVVIVSQTASLEQSRRTPEVVSAEALADSARAEARAVRGDALPNLSAGVSGTRFNVFGAGPNYDVRAQVVLRASFSTGGAEMARINAAGTRIRAALATADRARIEAERDAETAFADARILATSVAAHSDAYRANRRNRDIMAEQFRLSRGSLIDLLRTEGDYFAAARELLLASIERDMASYTLLARTGGLLRHFAIPPAR